MGRLSRLYTSCILAILVSAGLIAQSESLLENPGPYGPLTRDNLYGNLEGSKSNEELQRVIKDTRLKGGETVRSLISLAPPKFLRSLKIDIAHEILNSQYGIDRAKINLLYESDKFWSQRPYYLEWGVRIVAPIAIGVSVAGLTAYFLNQNNAPAGLGIIFPLALGAGSYGVSYTIGFTCPFVPHDPAKKVSERAFNSTGIEIDSADVKAVRALILACTKGRKL